MKKIFKYILPPLNANLKGDPYEIKFQIQLNFKILSIQYQNNEPVLWAEVDPDEEIRDMILFCVGTYQSVPRGAEYLTSLQHGGLAWHIYSPPSSYFSIV